MLEDEKVNRESIIEAKYRDISNLETKFTEMIETEIAVQKVPIPSNFQARRESEIKLQRYLEEKFNSLKNEVMKESKHRAESLDIINQTLEVIRYKPMNNPFQG